MHPISIISLGPGDPELITLKGLRRLRQADAIFIASLSIALSLIVFLVMDLAWRGIRRQRQRQLYLIAFLMSFILWASGTSSFFPRIFGQPGRQPYRFPTSL